MARAAADKHDRLVARHLKPLHKAERHEVADMQTVGSGVEADVKACAAVVYELADLFLVRHLGDEAARLKFFVDTHIYSFECKLQL